jgi:hypothetical protein
MQTDQGLQSSEQTDHASTETPSVVTSTSLPCDLPSLYRGSADMTKSQDPTLLQPSACLQQTCEKCSEVRFAEPEDICADGKGHLEELGVQGSLDVQEHVAEGALSAMLPPQG